MNIQSTLQEVKEVNAQTDRLLAKRNRMVETVNALENCDVSKFDETGRFLLPGRIASAKQMLASIQEQIDFNIAFCEMVLEKAAESLA